MTFPFRRIIVKENRINLIQNKECIPLPFSKKCLPLLLCVCLLALSACGGNPEPSGPAESSALGSSLPEGSIEESSTASSAEPSEPEENIPLSYTFTEEELLPGGQLAMDESTSVADFSDMIEFDLSAEFPDARCCDLSGENLSNSMDKLLYTQFDSKTIWPDSLPQDFDPQQIIDQNRNPGLGVRSLHEQGITGKGINIGIVDQPLLTGHVEYKDRLKMYKELNTLDYELCASMHGPGVASIALGGTVGVAPEANLYYVSHDFGKSGENMAPFIEGLTYLLDLNELLPEEDKLDVITISRGWTSDLPGAAEMESLIDRAKEEGIFVVTVAIKENYSMDFMGTSRDPLSNPDDRSAYRPGTFFADDYERSPSDFQEFLMVPMDFRATASPTGTEDYVNYVNGGLSWATPYLAGVYALAKQVKPDITPEEFYTLAMETSSDIPYTDGFGKEYTLYNLIDPPALIAALQNQ